MTTMENMSSKQPSNSSEAVTTSSSLEASASAASTTCSPKQSAKGKRPTRRKKHLKLLKQPALDLTFRRAAKFVTQPYQEAHILVVGCGGTGSQLAPAVSSLVYTLNDIGRPTRLTFIDDDKVEPPNIGRQLFVDSELNRNKAIALATRYGHAFGIEIGAFTRKFAEYCLKATRETLIVMVGCVDNPAARRDIADALDQNPFGARQVLWLDCGNLRYSGKVYFGTTNRKEALRQSFPMPQVCTQLPSVALLQPRLMEDEAPDDTDHGLGCAELINLQAQSLNVNRMVATIASDYLTQLLLDKELKLFATYFDLKAMSMRSDYIYPDTIARMVNMRPPTLARHLKKAGSTAASQRAA